MKIRVLKEAEATAPTKGAASQVEKPASALQILDAKGYDVTYALGEGEYGKVFAAYDDNDVEVAVKVMSGNNPKGRAAIDKEIENYTAVQSAREQSDLVAKHFPEVYEVFKEGDYGFIVMEILSSGSAEDIEISDLFSGSEGLVDARKDLIARGAYKDFSRRLFAFFNDNDRRNTLVDALFKGIDYKSADPEVKKMFEGVISQMKEVADLWRGPYDQMSNEEVREQYRSDVMKMENEIIPAENIELVADFDTKKELTDNLWAYYVFLKMLERFKKDNDYMYELFAGTIIENFMDLIRKGSPIPIHSRPERRLADRGGAPEEMAGISDQAKSLLAAIDEVERLTGLAPRDMHDKNAMIRPLGGDIVIVDLGLFKPRAEVKETIKKIDGKFVVYPKSGGKRLGTHPTKEKAQAQLAAIEISKAQNESKETKTMKIRIKKSLNEKKGVPHYTKDGKEWKGKTHKMPDGSLMSGNPHGVDGSGPNGESEPLFHKEELSEKKDDRCTRIAKRKYDVWPSAYASGAVVQCRKGKIWKDLDEGDFDKEEKEGLHGWFSRQGAKGPVGGWIDCNTGKPCGRSKGEKRAKPRCRPTKAQCKGYKRPDQREGKEYVGDDVILEMLSGAELEEGGLVCEGCLLEQLEAASCGCPDLVYEAEYQGRKVELNKPMRGDVKKFKVYVKDPSTGNVKKVNFGDPNMRIRKSNPKARKSFRARHNCDNPGPKTKARYWSCKKW